MNIKEENICRLCFKTDENDFQIIDEITRKIIQHLVFKMNLNISKDPVICNGCAEMLNKCYDFKSACGVIEDIKFPVALDNNRATFQLREVIKDEKNIETIDDNSICRFCSIHLNGSNFVFLDTLMNDVKFVETFQALMPEMDFHVIKSFIICTSCKQSLECYMKFVENCWDVEEKIIKYCQSQGVPSFTQVKLSEVLRFISQNIVDFDYTQMHAIKQEVDALDDTGETPFEVYDDKFVKVEETLGVKDEDVKLNVTTCEMPSNMSAYDLNIQSSLKTETDMGNTQKVSTQNSSFIPTTANCVRCTCDKIHCCGINTTSVETGVGRSFQTNYIIAVKEQNYLLNTKNVPPLQIFKCGTCTYESKYKGAVVKHMLIHKSVTEVRMYMCSICSHETKRKGSLVKHMLIHKDVTELEMYKCSICKFQTKHKKSLRNHMLIHKDVTKVEMYNCSVCAYKTKHKDNLRNHMLIHKNISELEMHKCSICTFETKYRNSLRNHMLTHRDVTELEIYKCSNCTFETKHKNSLRNHMKVHKNTTEIEMSKCSMCNFETKQKSYLKRHMSIHTEIKEVKLYKCSMCTYETKQNGRFKKHTLTHEGISKVECGIE